MSTNGGDSLLKQVLAALERGEDPLAIRAEHPGLANEVDRWVAAAARYSDLVDVARMSSRTGDVLAPGARLGDFVVDALLDRGGEGEVYRARQLSLGERAVALKVLHGEIPSASAQARFSREALTLADLHHPSLAEVFGFGSERGVMFLAMRLIEGPSLFDVQRRLRSASGPVPPASARPALVAFAVQVCEALATIHARGLIHRDVKPSNVIVEGGGDGAVPGGRAVLVDFGLARPIATSELTRTGRALATELYAPPEQLSGAELDARADVFALGATLHDLLAGTLPGERRPAAAGLPPLSDLLPDVDPDIAAVVRKACELDASWRYGDAGELLRDLHAWQRGDKVSARRPPLLERARRWIEGHPGGLLRSALIAAAVVAVGAALAGIGGWRSAAARAEAAWDAGDLVGLEQAAVQIPGGLRGLLLEGGPLKGSVARLAGDDADPLRAVVARLRTQDAEGAMQAAATEIERNGLLGEPALVRLFLAALAPAAGGELRSIALRYTARLFYERPVVDPAMRAAARPWRDALLALAEAGVLGEEDDLYRISALSGCGDPIDTAPLLVEALRHARDSERERLGMHTVERILSRGMQAGGLEEANLGRIAELLVAPLRALCASLPESQADLSMAELIYHRRFLQTLESLAYASRAIGLETRFARELPPEWLRWLDGTSQVDWRGFWILVFDAAPQLVELLRESWSPAPFGDNPDLLAHCCASAGDPSLTVVVRGRVALHMGTESAASFDASLAKWQERVRGARPEFEPDSDTHLVSPAASAEPRALEATRAEADHAVIAAWSLRTPVARLAGGAEAINVTGGRTGEDGICSYLVLPQSGRSRARFRYTLPADTRPAWGLMRIDHTDAVRAYYPHSGFVQLRIEIDGKVLDADRRIEHMDTSGRSVLEVAPEFLSPGEHELEIQLGPATNTTYRLELVELVPFEDFPPYRDGSPR